MTLRAGSIPRVVAKNPIVEMDGDELDGSPDLAAFARALEHSVIETIEGGTVTKGLAAIATPPVSRYVTTEGLIPAIGERLAQKLSAGLALR